MVNNPIYKPKGKAKEYAEDFALNIYTGCPHRCSYCFAPSVLRKPRDVFHNTVTPRDGIVEATKKQLEHWQKNDISDQLIHLCFTCDPFPYGYDHSPTLEIVKAIKESGNHVQLLTKNFAGNPGTGRRGDIALFSLLNLLDKDDWFGITYDGTRGIYQDVESMSLEASTVMHHMHFHTNTWVSFEPVIDEQQVLHFIRGNHESIDIAKFGKLNYHPKPDTVEDWAKFGYAAEDLSKELGVRYYVKESLRTEMRSAH